MSLLVRCCLHSVVEGVVVVMGYTASGLVCCVIVMPSSSR